MNLIQLWSRRKTERKIDFRPDADPESPYAQLRRLQRALELEVPPKGDLEDVPDALDALREFTYRKVFSGSTHDDFVALDTTDPQRIDWLLAVAATYDEHFKGSKESDKSNVSNRRTS